MYKNLKYNTEFIANTHFLSWVLCWLDVMTKCNRYLIIFSEITLCIRIKNDVVAMESNDHVKISCSTFY
jgi:hypothetical protein